MRNKSSTINVWWRCVMLCVAVSLSLVVQVRAEEPTVSLRGALTNNSNVTALYTLLDGPRVFHYHPYAKVIVFLEDLERRFPGLVEVYDAITTFGLQGPGLCNGPNKTMSTCQSPVVRLTNEMTLPDASRPEVFFSGALHGNERVGPMATLEMAIALVEHYTTSQWARRMLDTRAIYIMPFPNVLGFSKFGRVENSMDPNRDFPYNTKKCLQTVTARTIYELWSRHLFQLAITFHGGMQAIAYEWGSMNYRRHYESPDDYAQLEIARTMSRFAGSFHEQSYPTGPMTKVVYPVNGGMEDWGYAASWDTDFVFDCDAGDKYGGYSVSRQRARRNNASFRAFNFLVETSDKKHPPDDSLGNSTHMLQREGNGDGHVPRNMRLMAVMIDLVQPYITTQPHGIVERNDVNLPFLLRWAVRGCLTVNSSAIFWGKWSDDHTSTQNTAPTINAGEASQLLIHNSDKWWFPHVEGCIIAKHIGPSKGWLPLNLEKMTGDSQTTLHQRDYDLLTANFSSGDEFAALLPQFERQGNYFVVATAEVDTFMLKQMRPMPRDTPPQSNFVNARLNPNWYSRVFDDIASEAHEIRGQRVWNSQPVKVIVK